MAPKERPCVVALERLYFVVSLYQYDSRVVMVGKNDPHDVNERRGEASSQSRGDFVELT